MTPEELRSISDSLNDARGTGGQTKLARLLDWNPSTVRRKLSGKMRITQSEELAIIGARGGEKVLGAFVPTQGDAIQRVENCYKAFLLP